MLNNINNRFDKILLNNIKNKHLKKIEIKIEKLCEKILTEKDHKFKKILIKRKLKYDRYIQLIYDKKKKIDFFKNMIKKYNIILNSKPENNVYNAITFKFSIIILKNDKYIIIENFHFSNIYNQIQFIPYINTFVAIDKYNEYVYKKIIESKEILDNIISNYYSNN